MTFTPNAYRTVTPDPANAQSNCCSGTDLIWPEKSAFENKTFWLDASLECIAQNVSVSQFSYSQIYGDTNLTVIAQLQVGNQCGLYLSGGTANTVYAFRIAALMTDESIFTWDVTLPIGNDDIPWPTDTTTNTVLLNGAVLTFAGRTLPVTTG